MANLEFQFYHAFTRADGREPDPVEVAKLKRNLDQAFDPASQEHSS